MLYHKINCRILLLLVLSNQLFAQAGPEVTCSDCEQLSSLTRNVKPTTGFWFNPEQSGSGLSIEVKKRTVFGAYYGYDDEGKPVWFTFVGQLVPSDTTGIMWILDSDLSEFKDGNSLNNDYQAPTLVNPEHQIHIEFNNMNHASFSVDAGSVQNIVPLSYGVPHNTYFPEKTSLTIPNLKGFWVFSLRVNTEIHPVNQYFISGFQLPFMVYLSEGFLRQYEDGTSNISFGVNELLPAPELGLRIGSVGCYTFFDENNDLKGPICSFSAFVDEVREFIMPMGSIGIDKLFGETEDGYTFKAFRYDYCDFNLNDINYVCEYDYSENKQLEFIPKNIIPKSKKVQTNQNLETLTKHGEIGGQAYEAIKTLKLDLARNKSK